MIGASKTFRPPHWATTSVVLGCAAFCSLGFWQLNRADEKRQLLAGFDAVGVAAVLTSPPADEEAAGKRYSPMHVSGRFDTNRQFLLDNMMHNGKAGYYVITPLLGDGPALLVNRGWVPADPDRTVLPEVLVGTGMREVAGRLAPLPRPGLALQPPDDSGEPQWPHRQSFPTPEYVRAQLEYPVTGYQLLMDPDQEDGFVRDWRPAVMSPNKHVSYAVQWFGLAVALFIIYIVVNRKPAAEETNT